MLILSVRRFMAVYLTLFGYFGDVYAGTVLMNSNAIKNLPGGAAAGAGAAAAAGGGAKTADTVSPSPRTSPSGSMGHKAAADTLQVTERPVRNVKPVRHDKKMTLS